MNTIINKLKKMYFVLNETHQKELLRLITSESIQHYFVKDRVQLNQIVMGFIYSVSDSKRVEIIKDILENDTKDAIQRNSKHMRFLNKTVFKTIMHIFKDKLAKDKEIVNLYPEFFI